LSKVTLRGPFGLTSEDTLSSAPKGAYFADDYYREFFHCHDPSLATGAKSQLKCDIYGIPHTCFHGIEFLSMNGTDIPLGDIKTLRIFNFCDYLSSEFIQKFKNLEVLKVKGDLRYLDHDFMKNFPQLIELDLSDCQVLTISSNTFFSNLKLMNVSLANNKIREIGLLAFQSIDNVDLRKNPCTNKIYDRESKEELFKDLLSCDNDDTMLCEFEVKTYEVVGDLYSCTSNSWIPTCHGVAGIHQVGKQNEDVEMLTLLRGRGDSMLTESIPSKFLVNLRGLTFKHIATHSFSFDLFKRIPKLEYLDLPNNELTEIPIDAFQLNPNLKYLNLENCGIQHIHVGFFKNVPNLELLNLKQNLIIDQQFNRDEIPNLIETLKSLQPSRCVFKNFEYHYDCRFIDFSDSLNEVQQFPIFEGIHQGNKTNADVTEFIAEDQIKSLLNGLSENFPNLQTIKVRHSLRNVSSKSLNGLKELKEVGFSDNFLEQLPEELFTDNMIM